MVVTHHLIHLQQLEEVVAVEMELLHHLEDQVVVVDGVERKLGGQLDKVLQEVLVEMAPNIQQQEVEERVV
jgi:hypothetical protein